MEKNRLTSLLIISLFLVSMLGSVVFAADSEESIWNDFKENALVKALFVNFGSYKDDFSSEQLILGRIIIFILVFSIVFGILAIMGIFTSDGVKIGIAVPFALLGSIGITKDVLMSLFATYGTLVSFLLIVAAIAAVTWMYFSLNSQNKYFNHTMKILFLLVLWFLTSKAKSTILSSNDKFFSGWSGTISFLTFCVYIFIIYNIFMILSEFSSPVSNSRFSKTKWGRDLDRLMKYSEAISNKLVAALEDRKEIIDKYATISATEATTEATALEAIIKKNVKPLRVAFVEIRQDLSSRGLMSAHEATYKSASPKIAQIDTGCNALLAVFKGSSWNKADIITKLNAIITLAEDVRLIEEQLLAEIEK